MNLTRERARQLVDGAMDAFVAKHPHMEDYDVDWEERKGYVAPSCDSLDEDDVDCGAMGLADEAGCALVPVKSLVLHNAIGTKIESVEEQIKQRGGGLSAEDVRSLTLCKSQMLRQLALLEREMGMVVDEFGGEL
jgi:hypothetical protein